ncbi:MAG: hypothetical protein QOH06_2042 [Acidobacteriota bacterium]|jgi:hypothetical protein|nr:hypothetical protein [Acidobacteriota bacterium]
MSFELRLSFSGLTALVPRKDVDDPTPADEWLVVMPALERGATIQKADRRFSIPPHQAVLMADSRAVRPNSTKDARLQLTQPVGGQSDLLFQLDREILEIDSGAAPAFAVRSNGLLGELPNVGNPDELHDIKWVPAIDRCAVGGVPLHRDLLDQDTLRPSNSLAGVVRLDRGTLETTDVHRDVNNHPVPYEFRRSSNAGDILFQQALARSFRLRVPVEQEQTMLTLTDSNGDRKQLVVGTYDGCPTNESGERVIEVRVFNRELEQILGFGVPPGSPTQGDTDFVIFYRLSPVWNAMGPDDVALPYRGGTGGGGSARPCEPPVYPGFGG